MKTRGFEICTGYEDKAVLPKRADNGSCGYDFYIISNVDTYIRPNETVKFETGIKAYMPKDEYLALHVRSSVGIKKNIVLSNVTAIIDSSFYNNPANEGNICIALTNIGDKTQVIPPNARIAQGIFMKYLVADEDDVVNETRNGGIGSTGI